MPLVNLRYVKILDYGFIEGLILERGCNVRRNLLRRFLHEIREKRRADSRYSQWSNNKKAATIIARFPHWWVRS
jgi:hypothetical protein